MEHMTMQTYGVRVVINNATTIQCELARRAMDDNPAEATPFEIVVNHWTHDLDLPGSFHIFFDTQPEMIKGLTALTIGEVRG